MRGARRFAAPYLSHSRSSTSARCGRCRTAYDESAFAALRSVRVLARAQLADLVVDWPQNVVVVVRACAFCATPIARLAAQT
jgi:hypothetical protein